MTARRTPNGFEVDDSGRRVVVDPITRIEGHLRVEVNLDADNVIRTPSPPARCGGGSR